MVYIVCLLNCCSKVKCENIQVCLVIIFSWKHEIIVCKSVCSEKWHLTKLRGLFAMYCCIGCTVIELCSAADESERSNVGTHSECTECDAVAYGAATSRHPTGLFARVSENKEQHPCCERTRRTAWGCLPWQQANIAHYFSFFMVYRAMCFRWYHPVLRSYLYQLSAKNFLWYFQFTKFWQNAVSGVRCENGTHNRSASSPCGHSIYWPKTSLCFYCSVSLWFCTSFDILLKDLQCAVVYYSYTVVVIHNLTLTQQHNLIRHHVCTFQAFKCLGSFFPVEE